LALRLGADEGESDDDGLPWDLADESTSAPPPPGISPLPPDVASAPLAGYASETIPFGAAPAITQAHSTTTSTEPFTSGSLSDDDCLLDDLLD